MKVYPERLAETLQQGIPPVLLISGDEPLQVQEALDAARAQARAQGYLERLVLQSGKGFDWSQLAAEGANRSLFAERRILELQLTSNAIGNEGSKALTAWCAQPNPDILLLISAPKLDKAQLGGKWVKGIEQCGILVQVWSVEAAQLPPWLERRMRAKGLQPAAGVAAFLAEHTEGNLLASVQEIEKLLLLHGPGPLDIDAVQDAVTQSARFDIFGLVDAALLGQAPRILRMLAGLRAEGEAEILVLWALARELRSLYAMARALASGANLGQVLAQGRIWDKRKPILTAALKRLNPQQISALLLLCRDTDATIKGRASGSVWLRLEQIALGMAGVRPLRAA